MSPDRTVAYELPVHDEADNVAAFHRALLAATGERPTSGSSSSTSTTAAATTPWTGCSSCATRTPG